MRFALITILLCTAVAQVDDTPRVAISAEDFTDGGMIELAKRLQVPIKGDFTAKVP